MSAATFVSSSVSWTCWPKAKGLNPDGLGGVQALVVVLLSGHCPRGGERVAGVGQLRNTGFHDQGDGIVGAHTLTVERAFAVNVVVASGADGFGCPCGRGLQLRECFGDGSEAGLGAWWIQRRGVENWFGLERDLGDHGAKRSKES